MPKLDVKISHMYNTLQQLRDDMDEVAAELKRSGHGESASLMWRAESLASTVGDFIEDSKSKIKEQDVDYIKCASCDRLIVKE